LATSSIEKAHAGELNSVNNTVAPNQRTLAARGCPDNILTSTSPPIRVLKSFKSILMDYSAFRQHDKWMVHVYGSLFKQLMEHQRSKPRNKTLWKNAGGYSRVPDNNLTFDDLLSVLMNSRLNHQR
jgi:hypothetical protein